MTHAKSAKKSVLGLFVYCMVFVNATPVFCSSTETMSTEELLFMEIPVVISASRYAQRVEDAPSSVEIITAQNIKDSGATNIVDVLRMVAGINIMTISRRDQYVSMRGFEESVNNSMYVMVDNRMIGMIFFRVINFNAIQVSLEEIDRIEVIRGPGSSLYGMDAYCGVINIITKKPEQLQGTQVHILAGVPRTYGDSIIHAGSTNRVSYKVSGTWNALDEWKDTRYRNAGEVSKFNAFVEYKIDRDKKISIAGGDSLVYNKKWYSENYSLGRENTRSDYAQLNYAQGTIESHLIYVNTNGYFNIPILSNSIKTTASVFEFDFQHSFQPFDSHYLMWGVNNKTNIAELEGSFSEVSESINGVFIEDHYAISQRFVLNVGARYDSHPIFASQFSPRSNVAYRASDTFMLRLSMSNAYRNPSLLNTYFDLTQPKSLSGVPYTFHGLGNKNLRPEKITSYEFECRSTFSNRVKTKAIAFFNNYNDFITINQINNIFTTGDFVYTFQNLGKATGVGGEIGIDVLLKQWLTGEINYAYLEIKDDMDNVNTTLINEKDTVRESYSRNKVNLGLKATFENNISANMFCHYIGKKALTARDLAGIEYVRDIDEYVLVNTNLRYAFKGKNAEVILSVFNLFDKRYQEYYPYFSDTEPAGEEIGRTISVKLSYKL